MYTGVHVDEVIGLTGCVETALERRGCGIFSSKRLWHSFDSDHNDDLFCFPSTVGLWFQLSTM